MQDALRVQMMEFGRTPQQLFTKKHPKRRVGTTGDRPRICCFPAAPSQRSTMRPSTNLLRPTYQVPCAWIDLKHCVQRRFECSRPPARRRRSTCRPL